MRCVLTAAAQEFVTSLAASALAGEPAFTDLFDMHRELDVGHIRIARDCDLIVVAPATADLMAKMAGGHADDLATAVLLATDKPVLLAPAMNPRMWAHSATRRNLARLAADGVATVGPNAGEMAERGEAGTGRMAEPLEIAAAAEAMLAPAARPLAGTRVLITSGPTHEPIDPVRYIANRSSGKQGHAIARAAAVAGAEVTLVSGPVNVPDPPGVRIVRVESARDMLAAGQAALPADVAVFAAAVADWRVAQASGQKIKKKGPAGTPKLSLTENPDILSTVSHLKAKRPALVIGFAAETEHVVDNAKAKLRRKGCDWILANDVSAEIRRHGRRSQQHPSGQRRRRRGLADANQGRGGPHADRAHRCEARPRHMTAMTTREIDVQILRLPHAADLALPAYQSTQAAGLDLMAAVPADAPIVLAPGARALIPTGFAIALPPGTEAQVRPRSGLAARHGVTVLNSPGTIDADYRGELQIILINLGAESFPVTRGLRIAQLVVAPVLRVSLCEVGELGLTPRGAGGFGSTG